LCCLFDHYSFNGCPDLLFPFPVCPGLLLSFVGCSGLLSGFGGVVVLVACFVSDSVKYKKTVSILWN